MKIPAWPQAGERENQLLQQVLTGAQWGGFHPFVHDFETAFAAYQHSSFAIGACNGTVTLELALTLLNIGPGDEVIVPAISFISSATAISKVGATPVFVDIQQDSLNIDEMQVQAALSRKTKAVMVVHFGGIPCNIGPISQLCVDHELYLVEDAAHAHGSEQSGRRVGSYGVLSSFSFQNGKVLCSGEGGALLTSREDLAEAARSIVNCGRKAGESFYAHHRLGTNLRMTAFQAAVLLAQFEKLPNQIATRTQNVALLKSLLANNSEIIWQAESPQMTQCSWYLLVGRIRSGRTQRDRFLQELKARGIPCSPFYPHTLYQNPLYRQFDCRILPCPIAEARVHDGFWFPHRLLLADEQTITEVAHHIQAALQAAR